MHDRLAPVSAFSRESSLHRAGGGVAHVGQHVAVDVEGKAYVGVAQQILHKFGIYALRQQERGARVPQVVKACALREPGALERGLKSAV